MSLLSTFLKDSSNRKQKNNLLLSSWKSNNSEATEIINEAKRTNQNRTPAKVSNTTPFKDKAILGNFHIASHNENNSKIQRKRSSFSNLGFDNQNEKSDKSLIRQRSSMNNFRMSNELDNIDTNEQPDVAKIEFVSVAQQMKKLKEKSMDKVMKILR